MLEVIVALGLLSVTFLMMFLVTLFGRSPLRTADFPERTCCFICDDGGRVASVSGYPVCDTCESEYFPDA